MLTMLQIRYKEYKRAWLSFVMMTLMSIAFIYAFGLGFSSESKSAVAVVNGGKSALGERVLTDLYDDHSFEWVTMGEEEAKASLEDGGVIAAVILPDNFLLDMNQDSRMTIDIMQVTERTESIAIQNILRDVVHNELGIESFLSQVQPLYETLGMNYSQLVMREDIVEFMNKRPAMTLVTSVYDSSGDVGYSQLQQSFMGFMLFLSLFTMIFGVGGIVEDKEMKIWHRQRVSPLTKWYIMGSVLIMGFIMGMVQLLLIVVSGKYIFNIDLGHSLIGLILLLSGYTFAAISMGLLVSLNVKSHQQLSAITPLIIVATSMLGGCMWPLEFVTNPVIRFLSLLTPQRYGMEGLEVLLVRQQGFEDVLFSLMKVLLLGGVFLALALLSGGKSQESA